MLTTTKIVAVVEDDASMLKGLANLLSVHGFATELYSSAEEYLTCAAESEAVCLLLDIHLGGISGIELTRRLAASGSRLPIIFMTATEDEKLQEEVMAAGCVAYLCKPFLASTLVEALNRAAPDHGA